MFFFFLFFFFFFFFFSRSRILCELFPDLEVESIAAVLAAFGHDMQRTMDYILKDDSSNEPAETTWSKVSKQKHQRAHRNRKIDLSKLSDSVGDGFSAPTMSPWQMNSGKLVDQTKIDQLKVRFPSISTSDIEAIYQACERQYDHTLECLSDIFPEARVRELGDPCPPDSSAVHSTKPKPATFASTDAFEKVTIVPQKPQRVNTSNSGGWSKQGAPIRAPPRSHKPSQTVSAQAARESAMRFALVHHHAIQNAREASRCGDAKAASMYMSSAKVAQHKMRVMNSFARQKIEAAGASNIYRVRAPSTFLVFFFFLAKNLCQMAKLIEFDIVFDSSICMA
jgi:hypothetical protein